MSPRRSALRPEALATRNDLLCDSETKKTVDTPAVCVHDLLEEQALRTPHAIAVEFEERRLTFSELHSRAIQLAHLLRSKGVGADNLVGLCIERPLEMVVALLGVLKTGGAYVSLDPSYGNGRISLYS